MLRGHFRTLAQAGDVLPGTRSTSIARVDDPILRATDATGEVYDDPSEDALFMFLEEMAPGSSLRVERLEAGREGEWAQVALKDTGLYEFDSSQHIRYVSSLRNIHEFLTKWAFDLPDE